MQSKRIVITGGPGTGKSSVIKDLELRGYCCLHEVSREITAEAQKQGIEQLFLDQPLLFSEKLLKARINQHKEAALKQKDVFLDRGIPDVTAYMNYFGTTYPSKFRLACKEFKYDQVFLLPPWEEIYEKDNERYESFEEAQTIHNFLKETYLTFGYIPIEVPKNSITARSEFILSNL